MSNRPKRSQRPGHQPVKGSRSSRNSGAWVVGLAALAAAAVAAVVIMNRQPAPGSTTANKLTNAPPSTSASVASPGSPSTPSTNTVVTTPTGVTTNPAALPTLPVKQALMVTVELDFGPTMPSIADALLHIERRHQPDDGIGRVFAILDAYGEPTADGKKLHISMHVSPEKTGIGSLVFRRSGETLWSNRIVPAVDGSLAAGPTGLVILLDDGAGHVFTVDGSAGPESIMQATLKESGLTVDQFWLDGTEREATFIYSACGCPVKAMCRRVGQRTVRTKDTPVLFPDDPAVVAVIRGLMGW